jgi:hypothetical protein
MRNDLWVEKDSGESAQIITVDKRIGSVRVSSDRKTVKV